MATRIIFLALLAAASSEPMSEKEKGLDSLVPYTCTVLANILPRLAEVLPKCGGAECSLENQVVGSHLLFFTIFFGKAPSSL